MKTCRRCKKDLPNVEFPRCSRLKDGLSIYCRDCHAAMKKTHTWISLDKNAHGTEVPLYGKIPAKRKQTDETYEKVYAALGYWIKNKTLTERQAEALYLYEIELFSYQEIGDFCRCTWENVRAAHKKAIERLRRFYGVETA